MTNCPNCGAPFTGGKCAYCGTERAEERREYCSRIEMTATGITLSVEPIPLISPLRRLSVSELARMGAGA